MADPHTPTRRRDERGAVLVLTAIAMTALLSFTSLAVDMGMIRSKRSAYQHAADNAALLGGWHLSQIDLSSTATLNAGLNAASNAIKQSALENLGIPFSAWNGCSDAGALSPGYVATNDTAISNTCISFNPYAAPRQTRVRLPDGRVDHFFGLGTTTLSASAGTEGSSCDPNVDICSTPTTTTTRPTTTTSRPPTTTTRPPTTTTRPSSTTTRAVTTTSRPAATTTRPATTTTRRPATTTTRPPTTTTRRPATTTSRPATTTTRPPTTTTRRPTTTTMLDLGS